MHQPAADAILNKINSNQFLFPFCVERLLPLHSSSQASIFNTPASVDAKNLHGAQHELNSNRKSVLELHTSKAWDTQRLQSRSFWRGSQKPTTHCHPHRWSYCEYSIKHGYTMKLIQPVTRSSYYCDWLYTCRS